MPVEFPDAWREVLAVKIGHWAYLTDTERARLEGVTVDLIAHKRWEAAQARCDAWLHEYANRQDWGTLAPGRAGSLPSGLHYPGRFDASPDA